MSEKWDIYRVHREREVIDRTLRKILFKESKGKPYDFAVGLIGDLIQFYSISFRFIKKNPLLFKEFLLGFNEIKQIYDGFNRIHSFVDHFDKNIPLVKFGEEFL